MTEFKKYCHKSTGKIWELKGIYPCGCKCHELVLDKRKIFVTKANFNKKFKILKNKDFNQQYEPLPDQEPKQTEWLVGNSDEPVKISVEADITGKNKEIEANFKFKA